MLIRPPELQWPLDVGENFSGAATTNDGDGSVVQHPPQYALVHIDRFDLMDIEFNRPVSDQTGLDDNASTCDCEFTRLSGDQWVEP